MATGIKPRTPDIEGIDHPKVLSYLDVLRDKRPVGRRVAVIGAGGIGFDVGEYLTHEGESGALAPAKFNDEWGIDTAYAQAGGLRAAQVEAPTRQVHLLQRKTSKVGDQLGKTTGWIHRTSLKARNVGMSSGVAYERVDDAGLHITIDGGASQVLDVDHIVVCAGQEPLRALYDTLVAAGQSAHLIGGADVAAELDAKRAILQGTTLAARHLIFSIETPRRHLMTEAPKNIHPAVARSLDTWHHMVASRDLSNLLSIVHPDAVFRSPMANTAYTSAPALMLALSTVIQVFEDFTYHRQLATDDGLNIVLGVQRPRGRQAAQGH